MSKWIHRKLAGVKREKKNSSRKSKGNDGEAVEQEEKICDEVERVRELTHPGNRGSAGGGCVATATSRIRCCWVAVWKEIFT